MKVKETTEPVSGNASDKPATLENDITIMVPAFLKTGDSIILTMNDLKYAARA